MKVSEPSAEEATVIMRGLRTIYEKAHGVLIDDEALQASAVLSDRYLSGRQLPDKAIDVLDTAAARVAINLTSAPRQVSALKTQLHQQAMEIQMLEREQRLNLSQPDERLSVLQQQRAEIEQQLADLNASWQTQQQLVQQIIALRAELLTQEENATEEQAINLAALGAELEQLQQHQTLVSPHVDKHQIAAVIAEWTGVPLNRLSQSELSVVTELPTYLGEQIKGQETAIHCLHQHLLTARPICAVRVAQWGLSCWWGQAVSVKPRPYCRSPSCCTAGATISPPSTCPSSRRNTPFRA